MASFRPFFSRRQTDRTTLTFGSGVFLLKQLPHFIWWQRFYRRVLVKASRKAVCVPDISGTLKRSGRDFSGGLCLADLRSISYPRYPCNPWLNY